MMFSQTKKIIPAVSFFAYTCSNNRIYSPAGVYHDCEANSISSIEINKGEEKLWWKNINGKYFSIDYDSRSGQQCVMVECFFVVVFIFEL